jgi:hypothetical protein
MLFHDKYPTSIMPLYSAVDIQNAFYWIPWLYHPGIVLFPCCESK